METEKYFLPVILNELNHGKEQHLFEIVTKKIVTVPFDQLNVSLLEKK